MGYFAADTNPAQGMAWLEPEFWTMLQTIAAESDKGLDVLIREAFAMFGTSNRSASVRAYICKYFQMQVQQRFPTSIEPAVR
jgi:predicted DNA-binding ribbon-helix-helix protein